MIPNTSPQLKCAETVRLLYDNAQWLQTTNNNNNTGLMLKSKSLTKHTQPVTDKSWLLNSQKHAVGDDGRLRPQCCHLANWTKQHVVFDSGLFGPL